MSRSDLRSFANMINRGTLRSYLVSKLGMALYKPNLGLLNYKYVLYQQHNQSDR